MMSKAQKLLSGRAISVLLAFSTCLVLLASACGESDSGASGASAVATQAVDGSGYGAGTSPPMSVESPAVSSMSRSDADILDQVQEPLFYSAASPSLDVELGTTLDALLPANMTCAILVTQKRRTTAIRETKHTPPDVAPLPPVASLDPQ